MDSSTRNTCLMVSLIVLTACPAVAGASGARQGVTARPGEMVLLRDVHARTAYRPAPPGMALIADPSPQGEVSAALGTSHGMAELSDDDFAGLGAGQSVAPAHTGRTTVERVTTTALGGAVARLGSGNGSGNGGMMSGNPISGALSGPLSAMGSSTRGIGDTVRGALAQFPMGGAPAGGK